MANFSAIPVTGALSQKSNCILKYEMPTTALSQKSNILAFSLLNTRPTIVSTTALRQIGRLNYGGGTVVAPTAYTYAVSWIS